MDDFIQDATPPSYNQGDLRNRIVIPAEARNEDIAGSVIVSVQVDSDGIPLEAVGRQSSNKVLEKSLIDAVMSLDYTPGHIEGKPTRMWLTFRPFIYIG